MVKKQTNKKDQRVYVTSKESPFLGYKKNENKGFHKSHADVWTLDP